MEQLVAVHFSFGGHTRAELPEIGKEAAAIFKSAPNAMEVYFHTDSSGSRSLVRKIREERQGFGSQLPFTQAFARAKSGGRLMTMEQMDRMRDKFGGHMAILNHVFEMLDGLSSVFPQMSWDGESYEEPVIAAKKKEREQTAQMESKALRAAHEKRFDEAEMFQRGYLTQQAADLRFTNRVLAEGIGSYQKFASKRRPVVIFCRVDEIRENIPSYLPKSVSLSASYTLDSHYSLPAEELLKVMELNPEYDPTEEEVFRAMYGGELFNGHIFTGATESEAREKTRLLVAQSSLDQIKDTLSRGNQETANVLPFLKSQVAQLS